MAAYTVANDSGKFDVVDGDIVLEFFGPKADDCYDYVDKVTESMVNDGYEVIDMDDDSDSSDLLCWTHFRKIT